MRPLIFAMSLAVLSADAATAAGRWTVEPTRADFEAAAPKKAIQAGIGGRAIARCRLTVAGVLEGCVVARETPSGQGYGQAVLDISKHYRAAPQAAPSVVELSFDWWPMDTQSDWLRKPTADDLATVWPTEAWKKGKGGSATISCMVTVRGLLADCIVVDETPAGQHFGEAAIGLTPQLLMKPAQLKGVPVPSTVRMPVNFKVPPGGMSPPPMQRSLAPVIQAWPESPSYADVSAAYPEKAKTAKLGGRATLSCDVKSDGRLGPCSILAEEPKRQGFGNAARELSKQFRMNMVGPDGKTRKDLAVQVPIAFDPQVLASPVVGKPVWMGLPPSEDFVAAFGGLKLTATARAQLDCEVAKGGLLADCRVTSETPEGSGVGAAALQVAPKFKLSTWTAEGLPTVGGRVRVPLRYDP